MVLSFYNSGVTLKRVNIRYIYIYRELAFWLAEFSVFMIANNIFEIVKIPAFLKIIRVIGIFVDAGYLSIPMKNYFYLYFTLFLYRY